MQTSPGLQHLPPQTGWLNGQQSPFSGLTQLESSSQQTLPQMLFGKQHLPLKFTWPIGQQMPSAQTCFLLSQQALPQGIRLNVDEHPQEPSGRQLVTSAPQQTP